MFGDYDTGLTVTELSRYSRRMTGVKTEMQSKNFEVNAFASETDQVYARDEIPGDGTSGIYRLSRKNIVSNSEKITIEVRDRFHSEILISSRALTALRIIPLITMPAPSSSRSRFTAEMSSSTRL